MFFVAFICFLRMTYPRTTMPNKKIRIHLADDHQVLIDGLSAVLKLQPNFEVVGFSLSGIGIREQILDNEADVLIMDISMPDKDGIEVLREFRENGFPCKVVVLSSYDDIKTINEVLQLGAMGFLSKNSASDQIGKAVEAVYAGDQYFSNIVKDRIINSFANPKGQKINLSDEEKAVASLTDRELEVIKLIVDEHSGQRIAEKLNISKNTVETHRKNLFKKLNVNNTIGLVKIALKYKL